MSDFKSTDFKEVQAHLAAMTPEERAANLAKVKANAKTQGMIGIAAVAGLGFFVMGPVGLVAGPAALMALALLMGNRN